MRLRTALLVGTTGLVAGIVVATTIAVTAIVSRAERRELGDDLERSHKLFNDLIAYRQSMYRSDCRVVANEPRLRTVIATEDVSRETVVGVVTELRASLGSDLFLFTDEYGTLIADAIDLDAEGFDMSKNPVIAAALAKREGAGIWITGDQAYLVQACQVAFGTQVMGIVAIGNRIDDRVPESVSRLSNGEVLVTIDGRRVAGSALGDALEPETIAGLLESGVAGEVEIEDGTYLAVVEPFAAYEGKRALAYVVLSSVDDALAPARRLTMGILAIAAAALIAAFLIALLVSRRLSRPVDELARFAARVGKGDLEARAATGGPTEIGALAVAMNTMVAEIDESRRELAEKERLEQELEIAMQIQTSILPETFEVSGLDISAQMIPATEVGGDYYDILPVADGCWIGVGDVAGHGLTAGLEMLMVQSMIAALVRENPSAAPREHLTVVNRVLFENIRNRLKQDEHITLTLLRFDDHGGVTFAGAHEEIIVCRAGDEPCQRISTPGTWLGAIRDIGSVTFDTSVELGESDLMVLYSDGITEALNEDRVQFGIERLCAVVESNRDQPVDAIRSRIIDAVQVWQSHQEDDISIVVIRYQGNRRGEQPAESD